MTFRFWVALSCALPFVFVGYGQQGSVARGRYLVEDVAKCQDCHTPRLANGQLDRAKWLKGALLDFKPLHPMPAWRALAPDITPTGRLFRQWGEKGMLGFLKTGVDPAGKPAGPPMPDYRLNAEDAEAVVQYLKTLK